MPILQTYSSDFKVFIDHNGNTYRTSGRGSRRLTALELALLGPTRCMLEIYPHER